MLKNVALKKMGWVVVAAALLGGCAAGTRTGMQANELRKSSHLVTEFLIADMDFPTLQRNLFQHRAACGTAPRFFMHEGETSHGSLVETEELPSSYENAVLADLIQYPDSWRAPMRVAVSVYSYYYNDDVQKRIDKMLNAVRSPGVCEAPR